MTAVISETQGGKRQQAYKTEIIGGVVVHTPIQVMTRKLKKTNSVVTLTPLKVTVMMLEPAICVNERCFRLLLLFSAKQNRAQLQNHSVCNLIYSEDGGYMIVVMILKTVMTKCFRTRAKRQKGGRGRATGRAC